MGARSALALVAALLALPAGASAATTFGSDLTATPATSAPACPPAPATCDAWLVATGPRDVAAGAPVDGVLVRWRLRSAGASRLVTPAVVRAGAVVATETSPVMTTPGGTTDAAVRLPIRAGDLLGLRPAGQPPQLPAAFAPSGGTRVIGGGAPADGELEVQGVVEPDADGDSYGDETQDACPGQGDRQAEPCVISVPPPAIVLTSPPCANPLRGNRDDNVLEGTAFGDRIVGLDGRDLIRAGDGDDCLFGGAGNDVLDGDGGNDRLSGGDGRDRLFGGDGNDRLAGGLKADELSGGAGDDQLLPGTGRDRVRAGAGNDLVSARDGSRDVVDCGPGSDRVTADRRDVLRRCEAKTRR